MDSSLMHNKNVPPNLQRVLQIDQELRKNISELYMALNDLKDPAQSIRLLAEHAAIMVDMINEFKKNT